jgi:hypothetical protein
MSPLRIRTGAMAGMVGAIVLIVAGLLPGTPPKPDDSASEVVEFLMDKQDQLRVQLVLFAIAMILLLWFTAAFSTLMSRGDVSVPFAVLPMIGVLGIVAIGFGGGSMMSAVVWRGADQVDPKLAQLAFDTNNLATSFISIAAVLVFLASAALVMRTRLLPAWVGWLALVAVVLNAVAMIAVLFDADNGGLAPGGVTAVVGLMISGVWILATSVVMFRAEPA